MLVSASQRKCHLPHVVNRRWVLHGDYNGLCQFNGCLFAQTFIRGREGYTRPRWGMKEALREPKRIRLGHKNYWNIKRTQWQIGGADKLSFTLLRRSPIVP